MKFLILLGPPGSGKGTQVTSLLNNKNNKHNFAVIATGDLIRQEIADQSKLGLEIKSIVDQGKFPDDDIIFSLIQDKVDHMLRQHKTIIFDGVPRTLGQAEYLEKGIIDSYANLTVISFAIDFELLRTRICGRYLCSNCGASYHKTLIIPAINGVCDFCSGTQFKQRADDNEESVKTRLATYERETSPLLEFYKQKNVLYTVNADQDKDLLAKEVNDIVLNSK